MSIVPNRLDNWGVVKFPPEKKIVEESGISYTLDEIEQERQDELVHMQERIDRPLDEITKSYNSELGTHEALHAAYMLTDMLSQFLLEHPVVVLNETAWRHAHHAHTALFNLYQHIGRIQSDIMDNRVEELKASKEKQL